MRLFWQHEKTREFLKEALRVVGAEDSALDNNYLSINGLVDDFRFSAIYFCGSGDAVNNLPSLSITTASGAAADIAVVEENRLHRLGKRLSLIKEIEIGDSKFDRRYLIKTQDHEHASRLFDLPRVREAVDDIFDYGFDALTWDKQGFLTARVRDFHPEDGSIPTTIFRDAVAAMRRIETASR